MSRTQVVSFPWKFFVEQTPELRRWILVKPDKSPIYYMERTMVTGRSFHYGHHTWYLSKAKKFVWCYADDAITMTTFDGKMEGA